MRRVCECRMHCVCECRKFADIGNTTVMQLSCEQQNYKEWCDLITVHALAGPSVLDAFRTFQQMHGTRPAAVIVAEMSTAANFFSTTYTSRCAALGAQYADLVAGFVCQRRLYTTGEANAGTSEVKEVHKEGEAGKLDKEVDKEGKLGAVCDASEVGKVAHADAGAFVYMTPGLLPFSLPFSTSKYL